MKNNSKLPEIRKEAFTKGREKLQLSTKDLAAQACLSNRQIEQLENGEQSSFYGAQVKVTAAKKVANLLGLKEDEVFDYGPKALVKEEIPKQVTLQKAASKSSPQIPVSPALPSSLTSMRTKISPQKRWLLWLGLVVAVVFSIINLRPLFFPEPVEEIIVVKEEVIKPVSAEPAPVVTPAPMDVPAAIPVGGGPDMAEACPAEDLDTVNYKPEAPRKSADVVYVQAKSKQVVCVIDNTGKSQNKMLESGVGASFYGKPPFKVLTSGLTQLDMYFQGVKVRLTNLNIKTLILEPALLTPSAAQPDSEIR